MIVICSRKLAGSRQVRARLKHILGTLVIAFTAAVTTAGAGNLDKVVNLDIKAQSLRAALVQLGVQAHISIALAKLPSDRSQADGLEGQYTVREALFRLLGGAKLRFVERGSVVQILPSATRGAAYRTGPSLTGSEPSSVQSHGNGLDSKEFDQLQTITVTGTHIAGTRPSSPLIEITREDIVRSGYNTVGDLIRSVPENFGNANPQTIIGSTPNGNQSPDGASAPDLFGLGAESTLTLINGQRLATDGVFGSVDISLVPIAVIDHIDVLTGGASAIYGSDAVAGVVNIVLRRHFDGAETTLLGGGTSDGGGTERDFNELIGKTWNDGGAMLDYEFDKQDPVRADQRDVTSSAGALTTASPGMSRSSFYAGLHQEFGRVKAFARGLYTYRIVRAGFSNGPAYPSELNEVAVHEYAATAGTEIDLPRDWSLSAVGNFAEERSVSIAAGVPGGPLPALSYEGRGTSFEMTGNGSVLSLPSGTIRGALGAGYRLEKYDAATAGVSYLPDARRTVKYAYGELAIPLIRSSERSWRRSLTLDTSARLERYSDFGSEAVPKIGLVYSPWRLITVRGSWGKSFRAPSLFEMHNQQGILYYPLPDPLSATGASNIIEETGGNRALKPETAKTWTAGIDYGARTLRGVSGSVTYFRISYRQRIGQLANPYTALTDPLNASFVLRSPSASYVQQLIDSADYIINLVGSPIDPAGIPAIVNLSYVNVASQDVSGVNLEVRYRRRLSWGEIEPFANCAFLDLRQKFVPEAPEVQISGRVFEPAKVNARGGMSWVSGVWTVTGFANYVGPEVNTYQPTSPHVASWTTADFNAAFRPRGWGAVHGLGISLSVQNAFNRAPPLVQFDQFVPGIHYDPLNASVFGRVVRLSASWVFR